MILDLSQLKNEELIIMSFIIHKNHNEQFLIYGKLKVISSRERILVFR